MLGNAPISIDELRTNLSEFIGRVMYGQDRIVIKKYNRKAAVLLSVEEYENLRDPRKRFTSKADWDKFFIFTDRVRDTISIKDQQKLEKIIDEEVKAVRAKNHKKRHDQ